ncbi:hypothetical protein GQ457_15G021130 [Hibiscus cannabinus]
MGIRFELHATSAGDDRMHVLENMKPKSLLTNMHKEKLMSEDTRNIEKKHVKEFHQYQQFNLACKPDKRVFRYTSYLINGWRFNTKEHDLQLKLQNSGVFVKGDESICTKDEGNESDHNGFTSINDEDDELAD